VQAALSPEPAQLNQIDAIVQICEMMGGGVSPISTRPRFVCHGILRRYERPRDCSCHIIHLSYFLRLGMAFGSLFDKDAPPSATNPIYRGRSFRSWAGL